MLQSMGSQRVGHDFATEQQRHLSQSRCSCFVHLLRSKNRIQEKQWFLNYREKINGNWFDREFQANNLFQWFLWPLGTSLRFCLEKACSEARRRRKRPGLPLETLCFLLSPHSIQIVAFPWENRPSKSVAGTWHCLFELDTRNVARWIAFTDT